MTGNHLRPNASDKNPLGSDPRRFCPRACAARLDDASHRAFNNLIALGIEEECQLIVITAMQMVMK